jgi:hypothetical protein
VVDAHEDYSALRYGYTWSASLYNGTQFTIGEAKIRVICWTRGVDVPVSFEDVEPFIGAGGIPPGLSVKCWFNCRRGATRAEFRVLDYTIVR